MIKVQTVLAILRIVTVYAPQAGLPESEKEIFWQTLDSVMPIPNSAEFVVLAGDLNGHVGMHADGFPGIHGGFGFGTRNKEGLAILEFAASTNLILANTFYSKKLRDRATYYSGGNLSQVDYILVPKNTRKLINDIYVISTEECVRQHRLLVMDWKIRTPTQHNQTRRRKIRTWKLQEEETHMLFQRDTEAQIRSIPKNLDLEEEWTCFKMAMLKVAEEICGVSTQGRRMWKNKVWTPVVQEAVKLKRVAYLRWCSDNNDTSRKDYVTARNRARRLLHLSSEHAAVVLGQELENHYRQGNLFREIRKINDNLKEVGNVRTLRSITTGSTITDTETLLQMWTCHMQKVLNDGASKTQNSMKNRDRSERLSSPIQPHETILALTGMKLHKAAGVSNITTEMLKALGEYGLTWLTRFFNRIWREGRMPYDWNTGTIVPVYKGKGDPLTCNSYRPIKLLEHTLKLLERIISRRILKIAHINSMQRGFLPDRSALDAIFAVRTIVERHLELDRDIWAAFVDLEKAYDRVPRDLIWWALRNQGVSESIIDLVETMYRDSVSTVRIETNEGTKTGQSFLVQSGVHQGSALSPLLFIIVMEEVTKSVRRGIPWELLFADDLVILADSSNDLSHWLGQWTRSLEDAGLRVNVDKTQIMRFSRSSQRPLPQSGKFPCAVCHQGVGANSVKCTQCQKWVHARCINHPKTLETIAPDFICHTCKHGAKQEKRLGINVGSTYFASVEQFCYLGHVLANSGNITYAVRARIQRACLTWKKFSPILLQKRLNSRLRGWLFDLTVRTSLLYTSEIWPLKHTDLMILERTQNRMLRWMAGVRLHDQTPSADLLKDFGLDKIEDRVRTIRLRWARTVNQHKPDHPVKICQSIRIDGHRKVGRPNLTWAATVKNDMRDTNKETNSTLRQHRRNHTPQNDQTELN
jgi:hypothetical protein